MADKIVLSLKEYLARQLAEILGPDNMWFAGEKLHRSPTRNEAAMHYIEQGGARHFAEIYAPVKESASESARREEKKK